MKLYLLLIPLLAAMACGGVSQLEYDDLSDKQAATTAELETARSEIETTRDSLKAAELNLQTVESELEKAKKLIEEK